MRQISKLLQSQKKKKQNRTDDFISSCSLGTFPPQQKWMVLDVMRQKECSEYFCSNEELTIIWTWSDFYLAGERMLILPHKFGNNVRDNEMSKSATRMGNMSEVAELSFAMVSIILFAIRKSIIEPKLRDRAARWYTCDSKEVSSNVLLGFFTRG